MTRTISLALAAAFVGFASPSFAADNSLDNLNISSGRFVGVQTQATRFGDARAQADIRLAPRASVSFAGAPRYQGSEQSTQYKTMY